MINYLFDFDLMLFSFAKGGTNCHELKGSIERKKTLIPGENLARLAKTLRTLRY